MSSAGGAEAEGAEESIVGGIGGLNVGAGDGGEEQQRRSVAHPSDGTPAPTPSSSTHLSAAQATMTQDEAGGAMAFFPATRPGSARKLPTPQHWRHKTPDQVLFDEEGEGPKAVSPPRDLRQDLRHHSPPRGGQHSPPRSGKQQQLFPPEDVLTPRPQPSAGQQHHPNKQQHGAPSSSAAAALAAATTTPRPTMPTGFVAELTPVIRNTSALGPSSGFIGGVVGGRSGIVSPDDDHKRLDDTIRGLELSIPPSDGDGGGGGGGRGSVLSPRTSSRTSGGVKLPPRSNRCPSSVPSPPPQQGDRGAARQEPPRSSAAGQATVTGAGTGTTPFLFVPPPPSPVLRVHSAGNLDMQSMVKTVREHYARLEADGIGYDEKDDADVAVAAAAAHPHHHPRHDDPQRARREEEAVARALASVGVSPRKPHRAILQMPQQRLLPAPGPPIPLPSPDRKSRSFGNTPPRPSGGGGASGGSPSRGGGGPGLPLPRAPASPSPTRSHISSALQQQWGHRSAPLRQYQPTREGSLTEFGIETGDEGLDAIFKESAPRCGSGHFRSVSAGPPTGQHPALASLSSDSGAPDSPTVLRNAIPLDQRDWSIPSIRLAHHLNSGNSIGTDGTYELDEEDDILLLVRGGPQGQEGEAQEEVCYDDDATLSTLGSGAHLPLRPSPSGEMTYQDRRQEEDEDENEGGGGDGAPTDLTAADGGTVQRRVIIERDPIVDHVLVRSPPAADDAQDDDDDRRGGDRRDDDDQEDHDENDGTSGSADAVAPTGSVVAAEMGRSRDQRGGHQKRKKKHDRELERRLRHSNAYEWLRTVEVGRGSGYVAEAASSKFLTGGTVGAAAAAAESVPSGAGGQQHGAAGEARAGAGAAALAGGPAAPLLPFKPYPMDRQASLPGSLEAGAGAGAGAVGGATAPAVPAEGKMDA